MLLGSLQIANRGEDMNLQSAFHILLSFWWLFALCLAIVCYRMVLRLFGVVLIPQSSIGIVDKKYAIWGRNRTLPEGQIVALNGEAGIQADTLAPGLHFFLCICGGANAAGTDYGNTMI